MTADGSLSGHRDDAALDESGYLCRRALFCPGDRAVKRWECQICGFVYDEAKGLPSEGLAPGTRWGDIPDDWECPDCGTSKCEFEMVELDR